MRSRLVLIGLMLLLMSCAGKSVITDRGRLETTLADLSARQEQSLESYAALLRIKLSRDGKIDDFRVELFNRSDSLLSIYIRGFLGKSVLKATLAGDSLTVYFPSDNLGYVGRRVDLETGELDSAGHIIDFLLRLFQGSLAPPDTTAWDFNAEEQGSRLDLNLSDKRFGSSLNSRFSVDQESFPYFRLETLYLESRNGRLKMHLEAVSTHFNQEIPPGKFELILPEGVQSLSKQELAELLAEVS